MDEHETGMDPEVRRFFKKIMSSIGIGLVWLMVVCVAGFFFRLAIVSSGWRWQNAVFYALAVLSFGLVLRQLLRIWRGQL